MERSGDIANLKLLAADLVQGLADDTADLALGLGYFSDTEVRRLVDQRRAQHGHRLGLLVGVRRLLISSFHDSRHVGTADGRGLFWTY